MRLKLGDKVIICGKVSILDNDGVFIIFRWGLTYVDLCEVEKDYENTEVIFDPEDPWALDCIGVVVGALDNVVDYKVSGDWNVGVL